MARPVHTQLYNYSILTSSKRLLKPTISGNCCPYRQLDAVGNTSVSEYSIL